MSNKVLKTAVALAFCVGGLKAATVYTVDQHNDNLAQNVGSHAFNSPPMGQSFVPTLSALDVVEIFYGSTAGVDSGTIAIHSGTIGGPLLGVSLPTDMSFRVNSGFVEFDFSSPVLLTPGNTYVLELLQSGSPAGYNLTDNDRYASGALIEGGVVNPFNQDLFFREGPASGAVAAPEPTVVWLVAPSLAAMWLRRRRGNVQVDS
jgi:hypothetical protein